MSSPDAPPRHPWRALLADAPMLGMTLAIVALLTRTFLARVGHPYDLEWMEGGMLLHALRVMEGQALYVQPTADFIPFIYPPLYHWVLAGLGQLFGLDHTLGRAMSMASTLLGTGALVAAVVGETGRRGWAAALGAAGLFLACYDDGGAFFDLVRIDGMLLALLGWSLVAIRHGWLRAGGLLLVLAYLTKHNAAICGLPALIWLWRTQGRGPALRFVAWSVAPALVATGLIQLEGDRLFLTYLLGVPALHGYVPRRLFFGAPKELWAALEWAHLLTLAAFPPLLGGWLGMKGTAGHRFWVGQGVTLLLLACVMRGHTGGYLNVLIPGFWILSLWAGLALFALRERLDDGSYRGFFVRLSTAVLVAAVLWEGRWSPERFSPDVADREAGDRIVERIRAVPGPVLAPWSPWLPVAAGKAPGFHLIGLWDIDHDGGPLQPAIADIEADIAAQRWTVVMTSNDKLGLGLSSAYSKAERVQPAGGALRPKSGWKVRPKDFWRPRAPAEADEAP